MAKCLVMECDSIVLRLPYSFLVDKGTDGFSFLVTHRHLPISESVDWGDGCIATEKRAEYLTDDPAHNLHARHTVKVKRCKVLMRPDRNPFSLPPEVYWIITPSISIVPFLQLHHILRKFLNVSNR